MEVVSEDRSKCVAPNCNVMFLPLDDTPAIYCTLFSVQAHIRTAAEGVLNNWCEHVKVKDIVEGETCVDALKTGSVFLKAALFPWLGQQLTEGNDAWE